MWVHGDLKDRLGIKHRRTDKSKGSKLEFTPMFHEPHTRSFSEASSLHSHYEPTMTRSPGSAGVASLLRADNVLGDTPPFSRQGSDLEAQAQYTLTRPSYDDGGEVSSDSLIGASGTRVPASPHPSYYSSSDIQIPSPQPETVYRYTTGEVASSPSTRPLSLSTVRDSKNSPPAALQPPPQKYGTNRRSSGSVYSTMSGAYEMRVRSPSHDDSEHHTPPPGVATLAGGPGDASYVYGEEHDSRRLASPVGEPSIHQGDHLSTIHDNSRPISGASFQSRTSWQGGLAM